MWKRIGAIAVIGLAPAAATAADAYPVRLGSPAHVGERREVSVKTSRQFASKWTDAGNARKPSKEEYSAAFEGVETVEAVNRNGRPTSVTVQVIRCTKDGAELVPADATIVAETANGRTDYKVDGGSPADAVRDVLRQLIYTARPDEGRADQEFGTDQPRRVGESWPVNGAELARATHLPFRLIGTDFKGSARLADVDVRSRTETVSVTVTCGFDSRPGKPGTMFDGLKMSRAWTVKVPVGGGGGDWTDDFTVSYTVVSPNGTEEFHAHDVTERSTREAGRSDRAATSRPAGGHG